MRKKKEQSEIYESALEQFARYGYGKTTLDDIAADLEMTKSNLYRYARNKKDLYEQAVRYGLQKWQSRAAGAIEDLSDPAEQFRLFCTTGFSYLDRDRVLRSILIRDPSIFPVTASEDRFADINDASAGFLEQILRRGIAEGVFRDLPVPETTRYLYSVYVMFIVRTYVKGEGVSTADLFDAAMDLNLKGLLSRERKE